MERQRRGNGGFVFALILLVVWGLFWMTSMSNTADVISLNSYEELLASGQIKEAVITPNKETPTGEVALKLTSGKEYLLYIDDVAEIRKELVGAQVTVFERDVPSESTFLSIVLPILVGMFIVAMLVLLMMNRMMAAASGGGKLHDGG